MNRTKGERLHKEQISRIDETGQGVRHRMPGQQTRRRGVCRERKKAWFKQ
jgi:hypothetical protein